jgi:hypothetical protein
MAKPFVDISILGLESVSRALDRLPDKVQRRVVRPAIRKATKKNQTEIVQSLSGIPVKPDTGRYLTAMADPRAMRMIKSRTGLIGYVILMPTRDQLGIPQDTADRKYGYYPFVLEYGSARLPARAPIRSTVNRRENADKVDMGMDIIKGIERQWRRLAKAR